MEIQLAALQGRLLERGIELLLDADAIIELTREDMIRLWARPIGVGRRRLENPLATASPRWALGIRGRGRIGLVDEAIVLRKVVGDDRRSIDLWCIRSSEIWIQSLVTANTKSIGCHDVDV